MPKISLSGPAELLTVIPFHLGFQPTRSVVVVCFHGKRMGLLARLDVVDAHVAAEAAAQTVPTLLQGDPSSVALVAFEEEADEALPLLDALADAVEWDRVLVRERLVVRDGRWRSIGCDCCPDEGWLLPEQADVPAVADYVALGHAVLPGREDLARLVAPLEPIDPLHSGIHAGIAEWQRGYAAAGGPVSDQAEAPEARRDVRARARTSERGLTLLDGGDPSARQLLVNESLVAWATVLHGAIDESELEEWVPSLVGPLRDVHVRDAIIGWLCPGCVPLDGFPDQLLVLLEELLGPELRLPPAAADEPSGQGTGPGTGQGTGQGTGPGTGTGTGSEREVSWDGGDETSGSCDARAGVELDEAHAAAGELDGWDEAVTPRLVLARLEQVCRLTPPAHAAPLLSVVASLAWWVGDGAKSGVAVDRALELEPDHRLSRLVRQSLDYGIRPSRCA